MVNGGLMVNRETGESSSDRRELNLQTFLNGVLRVAERLDGISEPQKVKLVLGAKKILSSDSAALSKRALTELNKLLNKVLQNEQSGTSTPLEQIQNPSPQEVLESVRGLARLLQQTGSGFASSALAGPESMQAVKLVVESLGRATQSAVED